MKKILALATLMLLATSSWADTQSIHLWIVSPSTAWRSDVQLTNACNQDNVDATIKFWRNDGTVLANQQITGNYSTDANGEILVSLAPHQTVFIDFSFNYFSSFSYGSGTVTAKTASGVKCLSGGYTNTTTTPGAPNPYGQSFGYRFNNGENF